MARPFEGDREKLKKMTLKGKIDYIFEYYKFGILITVLIIFFVVTFVKAQLDRNPDALNIIISDFYTENHLTSTAYLNEKYREYIGLDEDEKDPLEFDTSMSFGEDTSGQAISMQKLMAVVASGSSELMITLEDTILNYAGQGMFLDLEEALPEDLFNYLLENDRLFSITILATEEEIADGYEDLTYYCGIYADDNPYLEEAGYYSESFAMGILSTTKKLDDTVKLLRMFFDVPDPNPVSESVE